MVVTQSPLHKVTFLVRKRHHDIDTNYGGEKRRCKNGEQLGLMFHQRRQERNGTGWAGEGVHKVDWSAHWNCGVKGLGAPEDGAAEARLKSVTPKFPFEFWGGNVPPISLSTPSAQRAMVMRFCCEWAKGRPGIHLEVEQHIASLQQQEARARLRPFKGFVEILWWNMDCPWLWNLEI